MFDCKKGSTNCKLPMVQYWNVHFQVFWGPLTVVPEDVFDINVMAPATIIPKLISGKATISPEF